MKIRSRAMNEWVFERKYNSVEAPGGSSVWRFDEIKGTDERYVWSVCDGDNGKTYLMPGYHMVNVWGYSKTEKPWTDEDDRSGLTVLWN